MCTRIQILPFSLPDGMQVDEEGDKGKAIIMKRKKILQPDTRRPDDDDIGSGLNDRCSGKF